MRDTSAIRRKTMRAVKSKNTRPEMLVRKLLHSKGYRYRLHKKDLPGKPDLVFATRKKTILVNGCFWHGHDCRHGSIKPRTNTAYWTPKIERNMARDRENLRLLADLGWDALVIWECEMKPLEELNKRLMEFLG